MNAKTSRKRPADVLFTVERRVVIGEVIDGEGNLPPVTAGLSVIAQELEVIGERASYGIEDGEPHDAAILDAFAFTWRGNTYTVTVNPERK